MAFTFVHHVQNVVFYDRNIIYVYNVIILDQVYLNNFYNSLSTYDHYVTMYHHVTIDRRDHVLLLRILYLYPMLLFYMGYLYLLY